MEGKESGSNLTEELKEELAKKNDLLKSTQDKSKRLENQLEQKDMELMALKGEYTVLQSSLNKLKTQSSAAVQKAQACVKVDEVVWVLFLNVDNKLVFLLSKLELGGDEGGRE
eukprot:TRINITY_DN21402_c0_g1_i1.p2 TRINITY_DN21402_c0_g1~~TRINITY_DN21402_c0_g1_i1.p2  ORF type:complete len:113 (+),score=28.89 TRINITY_DN21402_c0_g1_i1:126-464(+)